jgi:hypothetical protein
MSDTLTQHGHLFIADITGYTSYVARTELEHSQEILSELLEIIVSRFETLLTLHKLEGDAVFAYVPDAKVQRGETLLELLESTYCAFRDRQLSMQRATTCTCNACRNIPALDLKFFAHHGDYLFQQIGSAREMIGSDVNLIHRLTKNHVTETTGWGAYALFTAQSLDAMDLRLEDVHEQVESYEHLGDVTTLSLDLRRRYAEIVSARRVTVPESEADLLLAIDFASPPPVAWEWFHDPVRRNLWGAGVRWSAGRRPAGRTGTGAQNHCAHGAAGDSTEVVLDWRPFDYSTSESSENGKKNMTETARFEPLPGGGTRLHDAIQIHLPLPRPLRRLVARYMFLKKYKYDQLLMRAASLAQGQDELEQPAAEPEPAPQDA